MKLKSADSDSNCLKIVHFCCTVEVGWYVSKVGYCFFFIIIFSCFFSKRWWRAGRSQWRGSVGQNESDNVLMGLNNGGYLWWPALLSPRAQKDVELCTLRGDAKARENQLASQSLALKEAKEILNEERQCRAQLEWQLLSSIKVS